MSTTNALWVSRARAAAASQLLAGIVDDTDAWHADAACVRSSNPEMWFGQGSEHRERETAQWVCTHVCPVRVECLVSALRGHPEHGIWGGTTQNVRTRALRDGPAAVAVLLDEARTTAAHARALAESDPAAVDAATA